MVAKRPVPLAAEHVPGRRGGRARHPGGDRGIDGPPRTRAACGQLPGMGDGSLPNVALPSARVDGLRWAVPKTDQLLIPERRRGDQVTSS